MYFSKEVSDHFLDLFLKLYGTLKEKYKLDNRKQHLDDGFYLCKSVTVFKFKILLVCFNGYGMKLFRDGSFSGPHPINDEFFKTIKILKKLNFSGFLAEEPSEETPEN